jgi:uncharacterized protein (TIGR02646 family)
MRYIPLKEKKPNAKWLKKADGVLDKLKAAGSREEREAIIDNNAKVWAELKKWLLELSHQKCWFTEAKDCFNHWHVEHYRPKKKAIDGNGAAGEGYWWLAFDWRNFRICGSVGNAKKGAYFPLRPGSQRATGPDSDLREEHPELLDPADEDDPALMWFNVEGTAQPHPELRQAWDRQRVEASIKRYELNFGPLADQRKVRGGSASRDRFSLRISGSVRAVDDDGLFLFGLRQSSYPQCSLTAPEGGREKLHFRSPTGVGFMLPPAWPGRRSTLRRVWHS